MSDVPSMPPARVDAARTRRRPWHWRPASRAAVIGWWLLCLTLVVVLAVVVGFVVAVVGYVVTPPEGFAQLGAIVVGIAIAVLLGYAGAVAAALLTAGRYVAPARRTAGFWLTLGGEIALVTALLVVGVTQGMQLLPVLATVVHALAVPLVVALRVPLAPEVPAAPPAGPPGPPPVP